MKKHNDQTIREVLQEWMSELKIKPKINQLRVAAAWSRLMGPSIEQYTQSIKLSKQILYISISSAPLRQELSYSKEKIIHLLNEDLGEDYIKEVIVR